MEAVYSAPSGSFVSGVGCRYDDGDLTWDAPSDPTMRWDGDDPRPGLEELPVMQQRPLNGRHGFVLHDACWRLLQKAFQPREVPVSRLLDICESLPFPLRGNSVSWGHDYGSLVALDDKNCYPWEDRLIEQFNDPQIRFYAQENPYNIPDIPALLASRLEHPPEWMRETRQNDCFSSLPWEILEAIAIKLPTDDALNLRRTSPAFLPLLSSNIFWSSRFQANRERSFVFEKWESRDTTDWMSLYRLTSHIRSPPGLRNRRRIWGLISRLTDLTSLSLAGNSKTVHVHQQSSYLRWIKVAGDVKGLASDGNPISFHEGCRIFDTHVTLMPNNLSKIGFSISSVGNSTYIVGIRLKTTSSPDMCVGFIANGNEVFHEVSCLRGFVLAVGSRGVHALQLINGDGSLSGWIGRPNDSPITERLAHLDCIAALEVSFDVSKRFYDRDQYPVNTHVSLGIQNSQSRDFGKFVVSSASA